ncbi:MAG TPA: folylpolyglutamate synthase/dihydrofolate synthase family protein [Opitutaceae bacterium]|jgi:dihydrofolate synthase/folylpolyglutamate synthase|nr:folylpolyglutamate synthase/dihydrofolate synthase family protein [Opitutaceae bacterium]
MPTTELADYAAVQDYLLSLKASGPKFGLDRMRGFVEALGHPERAVPLIHVAGTNGKGSVAAMLDAIFQAAGWRTGLYTSPHLVRLGERVQVSRQILSETEITAYTRELRPVAERLGRFDPTDQPSFFEFMTAMAFLQFARRHCDIGFIEVGLGGRLDATNVVQPEVAVITSIGLDHCEILGDTLEQIAAEKAGIIKPGRPVVLGRMPVAAENVIRRIAGERTAGVVSVAEIFGDNLDRCPDTNLEGDYQRWNAATALLVARTLPVAWRLTEDVVAQGLRQVNWPGRWQRVRLADGRLLVLDASHNAEGTQALDANLTRLAAETGRRPVVIAGALGVTRAEPLIGTICRYAREIHFVVPNQSRACSFAELETFVPATFAGRTHRATVAGLFPAADRCAVGQADDVIVVTGSIYLLGEVLACLEPQRGAGEGRLQDF